jgi:mannose-6-phosphate isomerase-like protein (cupin superfamily)
MRRHPQRGSNPGAEDDLSGHLSDCTFDAHQTRGPEPMLHPHGTRIPPATFIPSALALILGLGWATREIAFALESAEEVRSQTVTLERVAMKEYRYEGQPAGKIGLYVQGETPASTQFVTGRFVLDPGKTPHAPHTHAEEEVMIVESGRGEIFCDGKTTKVGPGSVMFTTPNAPHGITNTGSEPIVFYYVKWESRK